MKKQLWFFLKEKRYVLLLFCLFFILFALVYNLYAVKWEAYFYASTLCVSAGLILLTIQLLRFLSSHRERQIKVSSIEQEYETLFPPKTLLEQDYQEMVAYWAAVVRSYPPHIKLSGRTAWTTIPPGPIKSKPQSQSCR